MELFLIREDLCDVIKEEMPTPVDNLWSKKDDKARVTIGLLVEDNQLLHTGTCECCIKGKMAGQPFPK